MNFSGYEMPCSCITMTFNSDDTFTLLVNKEKITEKDEGLHTMHIIVINEKFRSIQT